MERFNLLRVIKNIFGTEFQFPIHEFVAKLINKDSQGRHLENGYLNAFIYH